MTKLINRTKSPEVKQPNFPHISLPQSKRLRGVDVTHFSCLEPLSRFDILFNRGTLQQEQKAALSTALNLSLSGTDAMSQKEILAKLDYYGVFTDFSHTNNHSTVSIYSTPEHIEESTSFILDCISKCTFNEQELNLYKQAKISQLKQKKDKTSYLATTELNKAFFNDEHIKNPVSQADYEALSTTILKEQLEKTIKAKKDLYLISNTNNIEELNEIVLSYVPQGTTLHNGANSYSNDFYLAHLTHEKAVQNSFRMRFPTIGKSHVDYPALVMANTMLGGYFGSLLMKNIREEKGLTYGINSQIVADNKKGSIFIGSDIKINNAPLVLKEIKNEILKIKSGRISQDFFDKSKNYLRGVTSKKTDEVFSAFEKSKSILINGLTHNYYEELYYKIDELTLRQCVEASKKHLNLAKSVIISCGPEQYETTDFV